MFEQPRYDVIDEIIYGETKLRLEENEKGRQIITCWSSLSKSWKSLYRYDIENNWNTWKKLHANLHSEKSHNGRDTGSDQKLERTSRNAKSKPGPKPGAKRTKNSKRGQRKTVKDK